MKIALIIISLFITNILHAQQLINNQGNRTQTYPKALAVNPKIQDLVDSVSIDNLENNIRWMQDIGIRGAQSPVAVVTQNWLVHHFETLGLEVSLHYFPCEAAPANGDTLDAANVIAIQRGTDFPDEYIVISSHYDNHTGPAADDNASGTSAVMEIARLLSQQSFKRSIMYIPFNAEEYIMAGSLPFVEQCAGENMNILGCFNLDMLGFFPEGVSPLTMYSGSSIISNRLWDFYRHVANLYVTDIPTFRYTVGDSHGGDHMPFNMYEYPALYIGDIEYIALHPCYHRPCDTLGAGVNSMALVRGFTQAALSAAAELADGWLPPQHLSAMASEKKITVSWDTAPETETYRLYKNDVFLMETDATTYVDANVQPETEYVYHVVGIQSGSRRESAPSNRDSITTSKPLTLPYFNDFENDRKEWRANQPDYWTKTQRKAHSGNTSLTVIDNESGSLPDNLLALIEWNWFSIPDTATNVCLSFWYQGKINTYWKATIACVEATTDRKTWNKIATLSADCPEWAHYQLSLNDFIGKDYVQIRLRMESTGRSTTFNNRPVFIDDFSISFTAAPSLEVPQNVHVVSYAPNEHSAKIAWDAVENYCFGYNIYRNGKKINKNFVTSTEFFDHDATSKDFCYRLTAVYPEKESGFSENACIINAGIEQLDFSNIEMVPNPTTGVVQIVTGYSKPYRIAVYNMQKIRLLEEGNFSDGILDMTHLPKGMYIILFTFDNHSSATKKIVIQ